jgi:DNA replication and repair protein RecF
MVINKIHVKNFRNYTDTSFAFSAGHNFIVGKNGTGKTNVIEAVTIVSNVRSFRGVHDREIIQWGHDSYFCGATVIGSDDSLFEVGCAIHNDRVHRKLKVDGAEARKLSDYFGKLLTVVISPEDIRIITDGPDERRRFFDSVISKTDLSYLRTLIEFRRVLSHRNRVLKELREKRKYDDSQLDIWDDCSRTMHPSLYRKDRVY